MRTLTFVRTPGEVNAVAAVGAREAVTPLPRGPEAPHTLERLLDAGARSKVDLWFVVDDVRGAPALDEWRTDDARKVLEERHPGLLCRKAETLDLLRRAAPGAPLAIGPWPQPGLPDDADELRALGVTRVWSRPWKNPEDAAALLQRAERAGVEIVLPLPQAWQIRKWEADDALRPALFPQFDRDHSSWAMAVGAQLEVATRVGELMELQTILTTKSIYRPDDRTSDRDAAPEGTAEFPYGQTEGFPLLYAENLRHPPAITPAPHEAAHAMRLDGDGEWPWAPEEVWLYIHVPFCVRRCLFCFCASYGVQGEMKQLIAEFADALCVEMDMWAQSALLRGRKIHTVYFGGGSPSAMGATHLHRVVKHAVDTFDLVDEPCVSVEVAPSSVTPNKFAAIKEAGANRVSFGIQSFNDVTLETIGSSHNRSRALKAIQRAYDAGFVDLDFDLMYGVPGQSTADVARDIEEAAEVAVKSVMHFPLHVTPDLLAMWAKRDIDCRPWSAARYHEMWDVADRTFDRCGYKRFGYSHYKRKFVDDPRAPEPVQRGGSYSRYLYIMPGTDGQIALGPTALGCAAHRQYENLCGLKDYVKRVQDGYLPVGRYTEPPGPRADLVWLLIERSTYPGDVLYQEFEERFGPTARAQIDELVIPFLSRELFERREGGYRLTRSGAMWMANVQFELLRRADLPAPLGHVAWE